MKVIKTSEASYQRRFVKKVFLKISQNSLENCKSLLSNDFFKIFFIKKDTLAQVFSCEFCKIFKNTFFHRTLLVAASETNY